MNVQKRFDSDIGPLFRRIHERIKHFRDIDTEAVQLTMAQAHVLGYLHERAGRKTSQKNIENYLHVTHPTVIGLLKRLEDKCYIRVEKDKLDHRVKNVYLTEKAGEVFDILEDNRETIEQKIVKNFTEAEKLQLQDYLNRIISNLSEEEE